MSKLRSVPAVVLLFVLASGVLAENRIRVASYNMKFLKADIPQARVDRLKEVIQNLDADVIGVQEIADRPALERIFPKDRWRMVIDDDSGDDQDVALVVRMPLEVVGFDADLDADPQHFLFPDIAANDLFPNRRDVLCVEVRDPREAQVSFTVMVVHAKARFGGRAATDPRREAAAVALMRKLERDFDDRKYILLGDFNDSPDDRSLNILETGDPNAVGGPEEIAGPFLLNLCEPLWAKGYVSYGREAHDILYSENRINTIDAWARDRNNNARGTNANTGDILFDQILIPVHMSDTYVQDSAKVFDHPSGVLGDSDSRASDHLPVSADFVFAPPEEPAPVTAGMRIASLLPNPAGEDKGREQVTLRNASNTVVNLDGWCLRDRAGHETRLSGTIAAQDKYTVTLASGGVVLTNSGDDVMLIDAQGNTRHHVSYTAGQAKSGSVVEYL